MDAQTLRSQLGVSTLSYLLQNGLFAVILAPAINMFPALGEEVGWRGLHDAPPEGATGACSTAVCWAV